MFAQTRGSVVITIGAYAAVTVNVTDLFGITSSLTPSIVFAFVYTSKIQVQKFLTLELIICFHIRTLLKVKFSDGHLRYDIKY